MLQVKPCHTGLRPRVRFFGLEPVDTLFLFPGLYVCVVFLKQPILGAVLTVLLAVILRLLKWGKLPGYTLALFKHVFVSSNHAALGDDRVPPYPSE